MDFFDHPIKANLATPLIGSLLHNTVVKERDLESYTGTPSSGNQTFGEAITAANKGTDTRGWQRPSAQSAPP